jgi:hypothetical protein
MSEFFKFLGLSIIIFLIFSVVVPLAIIFFVIALLLIIPIFLVGTLIYLIIWFFGK